MGDGKMLSQFLLSKHLILWVDRLLLPIYALAFVLLGYSTYLGLCVAPVDVTQGEVYRIIYLHVPLAALSLAMFCLVGLLVIIERALHVKVADTLAQASACVGTVITVLTLLTGAIWAKPTWGTWWIWDARLTSESLLLLLYVSYLMTRWSIYPDHSAREVAAWIAILGLVDVPVVHYSVNWWYTLHQGATLLQFAMPKIAASMLVPLIWSFLAWGCMVLVLWLHTFSVLYWTEHKVDEL
jgi:heme exporter protein C